MSNIIRVLRNRADVLCAELTQRCRLSGRQTETGYIGLFSAGLGLLSALLTLDPASAETLRMGGTGAATEMLRQIGPAFEAETGIKLQVVPSLGTSGGNAAAADGVIGISVAGRDLKTKEAEKGLTVAATLRTPFGLVTSRPGPDGLASAEIARFYGADRPAWPDGTPMLIVLRPADESDNLLLGAFFPGMAEAIKHVRTRREAALFNEIHRVTSRSSLRISKLGAPDGQSLHISA